VRWQPLPAASNAPAARLLGGLGSGAVGDVRERRVPGSQPGIEIAVLDWGGSGPLALLHHANGFCAGLWDEVAVGLRRRFRVLAIDARGHGDSSKPESPEAYAWHHFVEDLECVGRRLADDEGGGRIGLGIGHSFGGAALLTAAARCPDLFESLLLLDPVLIGDLPRPDASQGIDPGIQLAERSRRRRAVWPSRAEALEAWENHAFFVAWTPEARELYARWGLRERPDGQVELKCPPAVEAAVFEYGGKLFPRDEVHRIDAPTLFVRADRGTFSLDAYRLLAERMPRGRVESRDLGHLMVMEDPRAVVEIALCFADADQDSTG